jgi:ABC-2 type transport system ATP-binding protein
MIETRGLRRTFRRRSGEVVAVAGVDLRVEAGEVFGFLGPNGAGKTTTLRMLATLLSPTGGEARVAGCDLRRQPRLVRERIGYVAQGGGTDPAISARPSWSSRAASTASAGARPNGGPPSCWPRSSSRVRPTGRPATTPAAIGVESTSRSACSTAGG